MSSSTRRSMRRNACGSSVLLLVLTDGTRFVHRLSPWTAHRVCYEKHLGPMCPLHGPRGVDDRLLVVQRQRYSFPSTFTKQRHRTKVVSDVLEGRG